jgi:hypothetical protein
MTPLLKFASRGGRSTGSLKCFLSSPRHEHFNQLTLVLSRAAVVVLGVAFAGGGLAGLAEQCIAKSLAAPDGFGLFAGVIGLGFPSIEALLSWC